MKKYLIVKSAVLICFVFSLAAFAQTNAQIEKELIVAVKEIAKYGTYGEGYDQEKLSKAQDVFEAKLLKYTKTGATLRYAFGALKDEVFIATSDDGRFRIYSWDLQDGGTMHDYARVYQYVGADGKVYSKTDDVSEADAEGDFGSFVTDIFTLDAGSRGAVYIVCSTFIGSTQDHYQSADLYRISGNALDDKVKMIRTRSGLTNTLNFGYNFFSVVDRNERPVRLISFDKKTKTLRIPVVIEDKEFPNGRVTNRFISYRFDGKYFVKVN